MPTVISTKDQITVHRLEGFDELGGHDHWTTDTLGKLLAKNGLLNMELAEDHDEGRMKIKKVKKKRHGAPTNPDGLPVYGS